MSNSFGASVDNIEEATKLLTFIDREIIDSEDPATKDTGHHVHHECDLNMIV